MKNKPRIILENIHILDAGAEGKAVGRYENKVVFVSNAVPGDIADVLVLKKKNTYIEGKAIQFKHLSDKRAEPFCQHFGICGGCKWQHMKYSEQLYYKKKQVEENFKRIAHLKFSEVSDIIPSEKQIYYRNKLEFSFSDNRWLTEDEIHNRSEIKNMNALGFHIPENYDRILNIEQCYLQEEPSNFIRNKVREFCISKGFSFYNPKKHQGFMRSLIIRNTTLGEVMVIVVFAENHSQNQKQVLDYILEIYPNISSLMYVVNTKLNDTITDLEILCYYGNNYITEKLSDVQYRISPVSFFQTNSRQALKMFEMIKMFSGNTHEKIIYDLYSGTGTIALYLAGEAKKIIGIEYVHSSVEDAKVNAAINGIKNAYFVCGDIAKELNDDVIQKFGKPDIVITDPPRSGMHPDVVKKLLYILPQKIIYVSCNTATQARDLEMLTQRYTITKIQPIDMFPHTHHIENIVLLSQLD